MILLWLVLLSVVAGSLEDGDTENGEKFVNDAIQNHKVVVFSYTDCPFSKRVLSIFGTYQIKESEFKEIELDLENKELKDQILDYLFNKTGGRSMPRVFIEGNFVGGASETQKLQESGKLYQLLQMAGVLRSKTYECNA